MAHIIASYLNDSQRLPKWSATADTFAILRGHTSSVNTIATLRSSCGSKHTIFSGGGDDSICAWDLERGCCIQTFEKVHSGYVSSLLLYGEYLLSASYDRTICLWNVERRAPVKTIKAHAQCVNDLILHRNGVVLSASWDKCIRVWDLRTSSVSYSNNGDTSAHDGSRGAATAAMCGGFVSLLRVPNAALCLAAADGEPDLYCGLYDCSIAALDLRTGRQRDTFAGHTGYVTALTLANLELFSASQDGSIRVTDIRHGRGRAVLSTPHSAFAVAHRADGAQRWALSGHADGAIRLTNVVTGATALEYAGRQDGQIFCIDAATDDGMMLSGAADGTIACWGRLPAVPAAGAAGDKGDAPHGTGGGRASAPARRSAAAAALQRVWRGARGRVQARARRRLPEPSFVPDGGSLIEGQTVRIECPPGGVPLAACRIHYTVDGSEPVAGRAGVYTGPLDLHLLANLNAANLNSGHNQVPATRKPEVPVAASPASLVLADDAAAAQPLPRTHVTLRARAALPPPPAGSVDDRPAVSRVAISYPFRLQVATVTATTTTAAATAAAAAAGAGAASSSSGRKKTPTPAAAAAAAAVPAAATKRVGGGFAMEKASAAVAGGGGGGGGSAGGGGVGAAAAAHKSLRGGGGVAPAAATDRPAAAAAAVTKAIRTIGGAAGGAGKR